MDILPDRATRRRAATYTARSTPYTHADAFPRGSCVQPIRKFREVRARAGAERARPLLTRMSHAEATPPHAQAVLEVTTRSARRQQLPIRRITRNATKRAWENSVAAVPDWRPAAPSRCDLPSRSR